MHAYFGEVKAQCARFIDHGKVYQCALMKQNVHCGAHALTGVMFAPSVIMLSKRNDRLDSGCLQIS